MSAFKDLFDTYSGFEKPTFSFKLDNTEMPQNRAEIRIEEIRAELTCTEKAGSLLITAEVLKPGGTDAQIWLSALELGAKAEFAVGYDDSTTSVFCGCLYEVRYSGGTNADEVLGLELLCLDVKSLMMASGHFVFSGQKQAGTMVQEILGRSQYSSFIGSKTVDAPPEAWNLPLLLSRENDYEVLRQMAEFLEYEFYLFADTLYFAKGRQTTSPIVTFSGTNGILHLERSATLAGQAGKVTVTGFDDNGERVTASQERESDSQTASSKLSALLNGFVASRVETGVKTMEQATYLARVRMIRIQRNYGMLECVCCGLPELRPGRFVQISGVRAQFNGTYYLRDVVHTLEDAGFITTFTAEG